MQCRLAVAVVLAGCRLHFDALPDAQPDASDAAVDAAPLALACNTPVQLAQGPAAKMLTAAAVGAVIDVGWIDPGGDEWTGQIDFVGSEQVTARAGHDLADTGFTALASASNGTVLVGAYTTNGVSYIEVLDANLQALFDQVATPVAITGPRAVAMTGAATGVIAAVTGNSGGAGQVVPVLADGTLGTAFGGGASFWSSSLVNVGDRLALIYSTIANNCAVSTIDLAVTARAGAAGWGTAGQCTEASLGYSPGRSDALLVRHDLTDGDLNHVVASRSGNGYTIPGESRLRNPGNEPRPVGVADGYWVSYETGGTLEAAHVGFDTTVGTVVPLGPLSVAAAHETVVHDGEAYTVWLQDGLEIARLCP